MCFNHSALITAIEKNLQARENTGLHKPHIHAIAELVACMFDTKSINTRVLKLVLPHPHASNHAREKFI